MTLFSGANTLTPHLNEANINLSRKLQPDLSQAIIKAGLKDGMTISFHHAFRGGDKVVNLVLETIANMGFKNLTLASSSLTSVHSPLVNHIKNGVISRIYTSGIRGELGEAISQGILKQPVHIHSHGGRVHLIKTGELKIDIAFIGVPCCDEFGNANGMHGQSRCGSLGYAKIDAQHANQVVVLTESLVDYPNHPASISQDTVDLIVQVEEVGDASKIGGGETRLTTNPRELLIAKRAADVIIHSGYFKQDFTVQTGSGGASLAVTRFLEKSMEKTGITAEFGLGGITSTMVSMYEKGLIRNLLDVQCFDSGAVDSLARNVNHVEISANEYANPSSKGAVVDRLDLVVLSALEIDVNFNVNVITGSDGVIRGASGGHCDAAAGANLAVVVAPLVRGRIPTVVEQVLNVVTPGQSIDVLVTDHGIAVNPLRPEIKARLLKSGLPVFDIEALMVRAQLLTGTAEPIEYEEQVVGYIRYRDGSVIDVIKKVKMV
ncbi:MULTISPECIES: citrate lyase subunit alpha [Vibrio]|uniref:citrate lyase subunit alpha n=1 Tax=Vibrio TaxID=662 RepID=UPI00137317E8|nr:MULTISPECIES: citrate lyase subunit alpha [Vibrio]